MKNKDLLKSNLLARLEKGELIDVGRGAGVAFGVSDAAVASIVKGLVTTGKGRLFYIPRKPDEDRKNMKVLAPDLSWVNFHHIVTNSPLIVKPTPNEV